MSDDAEKPFDATPSRLAKAKREGNVVRAHEFGANVACIAAFGATVAVIPALDAAATQAIVRAASGQLATVDAVAIVAWAFVPITAAAAGGTAAALLQGGGLRANAVTLKVDRMNPLAGLRRMFSMEAGTHAIRAIAAVVIASLAAVPAMRDLFAASVRASSVVMMAATAWSAVLHVVGAIVALGLMFAFVEFGVARRDWLRKLRMSMHELKREMKEHDGDPLARARRKSMHRGFARGSVARVKDAAFVVVNPTHVAVALEYRPPEVPVPTVLVRAADEMALQVRDAARVAGVPVVENVALARALFADVEVGTPIPVEHYVAVAEVVCALVRSGVLS